MLRSIIAVTAGVLAGVTIVIFGAFIVTQMTPDLSGLKSLPIASKFGVIGVWFVGAFFGAGLSSLIGKRWAPASWVVAATMALFAVSNFAADPAPLWMTVGFAIVHAASLVTLLLTLGAATRYTTSRRHRAVRLAVAGADDGAHASGFSFLLRPRHPKASRKEGDNFPLCRERAGGVLPSGERAQGAMRGVVVNGRRR